MQQKEAFIHNGVVLLAWPKYKYMPWHRFLLFSMLLDCLLTFTITYICMVVFNELSQILWRTLLTSVLILLTLLKLLMLQGGTNLICSGHFAFVGGRVVIMLIKKEKIYMYLQPSYVTKVTFAPWLSHVSIFIYFCP